MQDLLNPPIATTPEELSLSGHRWQFRNYDERTALTITQRFNIPEIVARVITARGISLDNAEQFLEPSLKASLPDPSSLKDMDKASSRIADAIQNGETIGIFGDYDVDGATSTALLCQLFKALETRTLTHIPDRQKEGYGPNTSALLKLKEQGATTIITVDCGTVAFTPLKTATEAGLDMIVVDHHIGEARLPEAHAVINPNRFDESGEHGQLAAVGVTFLLAIAINRTLRERGYFQNRNEPNLLSFLDLVALGTICDVVSLTGLNRSLVSQGLKVLAQRRNLGLSTLADVAKITEKAGAYHCGFILGPRINAGGRVGEAPLGATLLTCTDPIKARELAERLNTHNAERQTIEAMVLEEAMTQIENGIRQQATGIREKEQLNDSTPIPNAQCPMPILSAIGHTWHEGVIGIVAGRIKEHYHAPAIVITINDEGIGKASARSIPGVDIGSAITAAREADLLLAGGGHAMAGGFSVEEPVIPELLNFLNNRLRDAITHHGNTKTIKLDGSLLTTAITTNLATTLERASPYGMGNPEPRFMLESTRILDARIVGKDHVKCVLGEGGMGKSANKRRLYAIAFRCVEEPLGQALLNHRGKPLHLIGKIRINRWMDRENAEFLIEDAMWA